MTQAPEDSIKVVHNWHHDRNFYLWKQTKSITKADPIQIFQIQVLVPPSILSQRNEEIISYCKKGLMARCTWPAHHQWRICDGTEFCHYCTWGRTPQDWGIWCNLNPISDLFNHHSQSWHQWGAWPVHLRINLQPLQHNQPWDCSSWSNFVCYCGLWVLTGSAKLEPALTALEVVCNLMHFLYYKLKIVVYCKYLMKWVKSPIQFYPPKLISSESCV